jgi:cysteine-rich repeat protein
MTIRYCRLFIALVFAALVLAPAMSSFAAVPATIAMQGVLQTTGGAVVADGTYGVTLSVYASKGAKQPVWSNVVPVVVSGGYFSHALGSIKPFDTKLLDVANVQWLGVAVAKDPELPRVPLHATFYARRAAYASQLACSGCITLDHLAKGVLEDKLLTKGSVTADKVAFDWALADKQGGMALAAKSAETAKTAALATDLKCTGCVSVAELKFDGDVDLGSHNLKAAKVSANAVVATSVSAATMSASTFNGGVFIGDGSKLTGLALPSGICKKGQGVIGVDKSGKLICAGLADTLPPDGLDDISGGSLTNEFSHLFASSIKALIPDNNPAGVFSEIVVPDVGTAKSLSISVDITNSAFGSLTVMLTAPDGSKYVLFTKNGKVVTSLKATYPAPNKPVSGDLTTWIGKNPKGKWRLQAVDASFKDNKVDGAINAWSVSVEVVSSNAVEAKGVFIASGGFKLPIAAVHPVPCDPNAFGRMYINSKDSRVWVCRAKWDPILFGACGNGIKEFPEQCDDGTKNSVKPGACRPDCTNPICGDKVADPGEQCDDGNKIDSDGCRNNCTQLASQVAHTSPGTFSWKVPAGVMKLSVVAVGAGGGGGGGTNGSSAGRGGGGGALAWGNGVTVTPGETLTIVVGKGGSPGQGNGSGSAGGASEIRRGGTVLMRANGGSAGPANNGGGVSGGNANVNVYPYNKGGGNGGSSNTSSGCGGSGGGGAGGYSGNGGQGGAACGKGSAGTGGSGAGGDGGNSATSGGGGGVGLNGIGATGKPQVSGTAGDGAAGGGGSGGTNGTKGSGNSGGNAGIYGGGGGGAYDTSNGKGGPGGNGGVRMIWGGNRSFPSNAKDQ